MNKKVRGKKQIMERYKNRFITLKTLSNASGFYSFYRNLFELKTCSLAKAIQDSIILNGIL